jgi:putative peptidoglycan binding protein
MQPIQHAATAGHSFNGGAVSRPTGPESHPEVAPARNTAAKSAAPALPAPVYHYNFPTKSGSIGRDFTRPLTPDEQSTVAQQVKNGQAEGTRGAHGNYDNENGAYHYNFRTKSGSIGRDFTRPLTPDEQLTIARQVENGPPERTQRPQGAYDYENGAYHYNFRTKSGSIGRDFTRPLTPDEQLTIARQVENGPPKRTQTGLGVGSIKAKGSRLGPQHFNLPSKPDPAIVGAKFEGTGRIPRSETWTDPKYAAFRDYHHEWHDKNWWEGHCDHTHRSCPSVPIILVYGGWYWWHAGYWYPAWGYDHYNSYYLYDGPIYAYDGLAPDQVVANVQAALQALGYYDGPIDGLLGAATREAIANYQHDHGLSITSAIDELTLADLGMS